MSAHENTGTGFFYSYLACRKFTVTIPDIVTTAETNNLMQTYLANKVKMVTATGIDEKRRTGLQTLLKWGN